MIGTIPSTTRSLFLFSSSTGACDKAEVKDCKECRSVKGLEIHRKCSAECDQQQEVQKERERSECRGSAKANGLRNDSKSC